MKYRNIRYYNPDHETNVIFEDEYDYDDDYVGLDDGSERYWTARRIFISIILVIILIGLLASVVAPLLTYVPPAPPPPIELPGERA
jgi:hypothetical protein